MQRVQKEIKRLTKSPPPGISAWPSNDENLLQLSVQMQGPPDTPYEQGLFKLQVCVPQRYPFEPPKVQFQTPVYHPNIDAQGRICLDVLNMPPKGSWGPALDLSKVLMAVRQLLAEPNPKDPLEVDIAEECASQPELFRVKARQHVAQHAKPGAAAAAAGCGGGGPAAAPTAAAAAAPSAAEAEAAAAQAAPAAAQPVQHETPAGSPEQAGTGSSAGTLSAAAAVAQPAATHSFQGVPEGKRLKATPPP